MSEIITITGAVTAGPGDCCEGTGGFPNTVVTSPLSLLPCDKPFVVSSGMQLANVNSPSSPFVLPIGAVTQAHTLLLRTKVPLAVSLTFQGNATPQVLNVYGTLLLEADPTHLVTALAVQGVGQVEYLAVGNQ